MMTRQEVIDAIINAFQCQDSEYSGSQERSDELKAMLAEVLRWIRDDAPSDPQ